jgi:hypothetical protein
MHAGGPRAEEQRCVHVSLTTRDVERMALELEVGEAEPQQSPCDSFSVERWRKNGIHAKDSHQQIPARYFYVAVGLCRLEPMTFKRYMCITKTGGCIKC